MKIHPIKLSNGISTFKGQLVIGKTALYFLCNSKGSAIIESAALSQGIKSGGILNALTNQNTYGTIDTSISEEAIRELTQNTPNSIIFEANKIQKIHQNIFLRYIKWNGKKIGVPQGFSKTLRLDLKPWLEAKGIHSKGI